MKSATFCRNWLVVLLLGLAGCYSLPVPEYPPNFGPSKTPLSNQSQKDFRRKDPQAPLTLREALVLTIYKNPKLQAYLWKVRKKEALLLQASLFPNPSVEAEVEEFGGEGERRGFDGAEASLVFSQLLPLSGRIGYRTQVAAHGRDGSLWDYEKARLSVFSALNKAFIEVLASQKHLEVSQKILELAQKVYRTVQARVKAGKVSPLEEKKAIIALENSRIDFHRARLKLQRSRKTLSLFWNEENPQFKEASGDFFHSTPLPPLKELRKKLPQNPKLGKFKAQIKEQLAQVELEKSRAFPDVTIKGGAAFFSGDDSLAFLAGLSLPLPLFDRNQGRIDAARADLGRITAEERETRRQLMTELAQAYSRFQITSKELELIKKKILPQAQSAFESFQTGYQQGKFDFLQALDAQRTYFSLRLRYLRALSALHKEKVEVYRLVARPLVKSREKIK